jgi:hypothetical protein
VITRFDQPAGDQAISSLVKRDFRGPTGRRSLNYTGKGVVSQVPVESSPVNSPIGSMSVRQIPRSDHLTR